MIARYNGLGAPDSEQPRLNTTAVARYTMEDPVTGQLVANPTGTFTLQRNTTTLINAAAMTIDPLDAANTTILFVILHAHLTERGVYKATIVLTDPATGYVGTREEEFRL